jgi:hypothetical protein
MGSSRVVIVEAIHKYEQYSLLDDGPDGRIPCAGERASVFIAWISERWNRRGAW